MTTRRERRSDADRGAVAVEFALIFPLVAMIILGSISGGVVYSQAIGVQNAVREGSRFGATADSASATWADDVVSRVRGTQFDDGTTASQSGTSVCVQLVKAPATVLKGTCSTGGNDGPALSMPALAEYPAVPAVTAGTCVVRVLAARKYEISLVVASEKGTMTKGSTALYERTCA